MGVCSFEQALFLMLGRNLPANFHLLKILDSEELYYKIDVIYA